MNADFIFDLSNTIALIGWLILLLVPHNWVWKDKIIIGILITGLAVLYFIGLANGFKVEDFENFSTLEGIMELFGNKLAVATGWVHYLAFDLMTGVWIKNNGHLHQINKWLLIPCLLFTFFSGPFGLLLYLILRAIYTKNIFAKNY
jgi:hypothetical protein